MKINSLQDNKKELLDLIYPIGSIYMSVKNVSPESFLGGKWSVWGAGRFPISVDISDKTGKYDRSDMTGGIRDQQLTVSNLPAHTHRIYGSTSKDGSHIHSLATANGQGSCEWGYMFTYEGHNAAGNSGAFSSVGNTGPHVHTMNFTSKSTGSGTAFTNMPPFISCYMWKRVS